ncbi:MAG: hypothetical protein IKX99_03650 [Lachnospiraceae bacterium]|nr:hypothetical protein [Lachnospiraceae bacterium]
MQKTAVDVICQHSKDGTITPLRLRVTDAEGELQTYTIKEFRRLSTGGSYTLPNGVHISQGAFVFECAIPVFGQRKLVNLYYEPGDIVWKITY